MLIIIFCRKYKISSLKFEVQSRVKAQLCHFTQELHLIVTSEKSHFYLTKTRRQRPQQVVYQ